MKILTSDIVSDEERQIAQMALRDAGANDTAANFFMEDETLEFETVDNAPSLDEIANEEIADADGKARCHGSYIRAKSGCIQAGKGSACFAAARRAYKRCVKQVDGG